MKNWGISICAIIYILLIGEVSYANSPVSAEFIEAKYRSYKMTWFYEGHFDSVFQVANEVIDLAIENNSGEWLGKAQNLKAYTFQYMGDHPQALYSYFQARDTYLSIDSTELVANVINNIGNIFFAIDDYSKAVDYFNQSLAYRSEDSNQTTLARTYTSLGNAHLAVELWTEAIHFYKKALGFTDDSQLVQSINLELGRVYSKQGYDTEAKAFYQKAMDIGLLPSNHRVFCAAALNLAEIDFFQGNYDLARVKFETALPLFDSTNQIGFLPAPTYFLAKIALHDGDSTKAISYLTYGLQKPSFGEAVETEDAFELLLNLLSLTEQFELHAEFSQKYWSYLKKSAELLSNTEDTDLRFNLRMVEQEYLTNQEVTAGGNDFYNLFWGLALLLALFSAGYYMNQANQRKNQIKKIKSNFANVYKDLNDIVVKK